MGFKKGYTPWNKGNHIDTNPARRGCKLVKDNKMQLGRTPWNKGKRNPHSTGVKNNNWKGGITPLYTMIRRLPEYKQWRSNVFMRDNWTCQTCGKRGILLNAHHFKRFLYIAETNNIHSLIDAINCKELWNVDNGVTLCEPCHELTKKNTQHSKLK